MEFSQDEDLDPLDLNQIEEPATEDQAPPSNCLVGRVYSGKSVNSYALMEVMKKAWRPKKGFESREWSHNLFLFKFAEAAEMAWVINNQPWHFDGNLFTIRPLLSSEQPSKVQISEAIFWVRVYDAPTCCMTTPAARAMANKMGTLVEVDPSQNLFGKFIRFKVKIDISRPLKRGLSVLVGGELLWLAIKYESLPIYCFNCGHIGHIFKDCADFNHMKEQEPKDLPFGPVIKASPLKKFHPWPLKNETAKDPHPHHLPSRYPNTSPSAPKASLASSIPKDRAPYTINNPQTSPPKKMPPPPIAKTRTDPPPTINRKLLLLDDVSTPSHQPNLASPQTPSTSLLKPVKTKSPKPKPSPSKKANKGKKNWFRLAREKGCKSPGSVLAPQSGKRSLPDTDPDIQLEVSEAKRLKFLSLDVMDESTAAAADEQPCRAQ